MTAAVDDTPGVPDRAADSTAAAWTTYSSGTPLYGWGCYSRAMVYVPHIRATIRGVLPGAEIWTCSLHFRYDDGITINDTLLQGVANAVRTDTQTWFGVGGTGLASNTSFTRVDVYDIRANGKAVQQAFAEATATTTGQGTGVLPNQCTVVCSLRTGLPGRSRRGRLYLPTLAVPIEQGSLMGTTLQTSIATAAESWLDGFTALLVSATTFRLCIASGVGNGANTPVTSIQIGQVVDTQRRRSNALSENPITRVLTI